MNYNRKRVGGGTDNPVTTKKEPIYKKLKVWMCIAILVESNMPGTIQAPNYNCSVLQTEPWKGKSGSCIILAAAPESAVG